MIRVLIFDLDGTLIDTMEIYAEAAADLWHRYYGISRDEARRLYLETSGLPFRDQLEVLFPGNPQNSTVAEEFENWKENVLERYIRLPEEIEALLCELKRDYKLVVSSNNLWRYVKKLTRNWPIDLALGFDGREFKKGPAHFEYLKKHFRVSGKEMLFIGDSLKDAELARKSGLFFVGVTKIFPPEKFRIVYPSCFTIGNLSELKEVLESNSFLSTPGLKGK